MIHQRKKYLTVTSKQSIKQNVDALLSNEYNDWKQRIRNHHHYNINQINQYTFRDNANSINKRTHQNQLLRNYIRTIYQEYNIQDPLNNLQSFKNIKTEKTHHVTRSQIPIKPLLINSNKIQPITYRQQKVRFQTPTKIVNPQQQHTKYMKTHYTDGSRISNSHHRSHSKSSYSHMNLHQSISKQIDTKISFNPVSKPQSSLVKYSNYGVPDKKLIQSRYQLQQHPLILIQEQKEQRQLEKLQRLHTQNQMVQLPIKQSFRYCLGCQTAIISCNIGNHEQICTKYQQLFNCDIHKILKHIDEKVKQFNRRIQSRLVSEEISQKDISTLNKSRLQVAESSEKIMKQGQINNRFLTHYDNMIRVGKKFASISEQVNKIRWFLRVREIIKKDYKL